MTTSHDNAPFFHVGILVPDLTAAIERFGTVLGLEFAEPMRSRVPQRDGGVVKEVELNVAYSRQGPPYLELIEAVGDGVYGPQNHGLHHIGAWSDNCQAAMDEMATRGVRTQTVFLDGEINLGGYFEPEDLFGVRFEVSPTSIREGWQQWVGGGAQFR